MKKILLTLCFLCILDVYSHEFNPAHLVINEVDDVNNHYEATWMYPFKNIGRRAEINFQMNVQLNTAIYIIKESILMKKLILTAQTH